MQSRAQSNPVGRDVQNVVSEAQELLKTVKDEGASKIDEMKTKVAQQYDVDDYEQDMEALAEWQAPRQ